MTELTSLIAAALKVPATEICETTAMANTKAWDSLAHMDLVLAIEDRYKVNLDGDEIARMISAAAIAAVLESRGIVLA